MTEIQQIKAQVGRAEKKLDKIIAILAHENVINEPEPFVWEDLAASQCRCKVGTLRVYKAQGRFIEEVDFIKVGKKTQYKVSAILRELKRKKQA